MKKLFANLNIEKEQAMLFLLCVIAYTSTYLSRDTFAAVMPNILSQTSVIKAELGIVSTVFLIIYGSGQFISGILADKFPAQLLVTVGLMTSGIVNFLFGFASDVTTMTVLWGINGLALSLLWAPLIKVIISYMDEAYKKKALINISISMPIGTLTAFVASAYFVKVSSFRLAFYVNGILILAVGIIWFLSTRVLLKKLTRHDEAISKAKTEKSSVNLRKLVMMSGLGIIVFMVMCNGIIRNGISIWVPTYLTEKFNLEEFISILTSALIPIINMGGIYFAAHINRKTDNEAKTSVFMFIFAGVSLAILLLIGDFSPIVAILFLGIATFSMQGLNAIIMSLVPAQFMKYNLSATITGFLNGFSYLTSAIGTYSVGVISTNYGWDMTIVSWILVAVFGVTLSFTLIKTWRKFKQNNNSEVQQ